ncbi:EAL domain-containing protein [Rhodalgimonas zhirmunskyi]|uniref:EAL domain-containing protein n=1 Tax=Rhodalgimonas zhirmunskyi TaxID=2964767 RepID=A0AAJ1X568_9RHOB|nr:EAL domain-containing protein [Rhodoalgimonas zhirmunskyi]MDQ2093234.1 EAL domain-containing protein [Rhodoalgimonas zhirmunskyi]
MSRRENWKYIDVPPGHENPLSYAIHSRDRSIMDVVEEALIHKQVILAYQPVVQALRPERIAFYEGLLRVRDETGRIIPAKDFITQIEETETGRIMDCLALEHGLKALARVPYLRLSLNMSARSIGYDRWMRTLKQGLQRDPTVAERLILEITERSAMLVPELVTSFMERLQRKGISFALDDFGAGFTSFRYLKQFMFDIVKIDGQFIRGIHKDADNQVLTKALVAIAQQFDMFTVAEFVESDEDAQYLRTLGVDCLQGYYYGAPTVHPAWESESVRKSA